MGDELTEVDTADAEEDFGGGGDGGDDGGGGGDGGADVDVRKY